MTVYHKETDETWSKTVISGVQWSDTFAQNENGGKLSVAKYATITFPEGTYEDVPLTPYSDEDAIVYGAISDDVTTAKGSRLSDLLAKYPHSGRIKTVNDNTNRRFLKNIKVVVS